MRKKETQVLPRTVLRLFPVFLSIVVLLFSCDDSSSDSPEKEERTLSSSYVDIPDCISKSESASRAETEDETIENIYETIRETIGVCEQIAIDMGELVDIIRENVIAQSDEGDWTNPDPDSDDPSRVVWGPDDSGYDHKVELYFIKDGVIEERALVAHLSWVGDTAKGIIVWDMSKTKSDTPETVKLMVEFDGTGQKKTMRIVALDLGSADTGEPVSVEVNAQTENGILSLSGAYYIPKLGIDDDDDTKTEARTYSFVVSGYDLDGKGGDKVNKAVLKLAIPPATLDSAATMFTDYSVREVFLGWMTDKIKRDTDATTFAIWKSEASLDAATISDMTNTQTEKLLTHYATADPDNAELKSMLFVLKLVNPAYFTSDGFFGTYDGTSKGTLIGVPAWMDDSELDIDSVEALVPAELSAYQFNQDTFTIE